MAFILDLCLCNLTYSFFLGIFSFIVGKRIKKTYDIYVKYVFLTAVASVIAGIVFALISVINI